MGSESMYSGLTYFSEPSSSIASTSSGFSTIRRPDRSPPACMLVCPPLTITVPSENALRNPYMMAR